MSEREGCPAIDASLVRSCGASLRGEALLAAAGVNTFDPVDASTGLEVRLSLRPVLDYEDRRRRLMNARPLDLTAEIDKIMGAL